MPKHHVLIFAYEGVQLMDIAGPAQVFSTANAEGAFPPYEIRFFGVVAGPVLSVSGLPLVLEGPATLPTGDTVVIPGGPGVQKVMVSAEALSVLDGVLADAGRVCSVCTGAHILAETGMLDGRRAVTHWQSCSALAMRHPQIQVESDPLFIEDGRYWTSAGVTAGIDLCLALVERDHGKAIAARIARRLVIYLRRPGGQNQFSDPLHAQYDAADPYACLIEKIIADPGLDWSVQRMAEASGQSLRSFHRNFRKKTGQSPAKVVEACRCDYARTLIQTTDLSIDQIALRAGFGVSSTLRRALNRQFSLVPNLLRQT